MKNCECPGISAEERAFLEYVEKCIKSYPDQATAARFGVCRAKRVFAGLGPGDGMRYSRHPSGKGLVAEVRPKPQLVEAAALGCCEWEWDETEQQWICVVWC